MQNPFFTAPDIDPSLLDPRLSETPNRDSLEVKPAESLEATNQDSVKLDSQYPVASQELPSQPASNGTNINAYESQEQQNTREVESQQVAQYKQEEGSPTVPTEAQSPAANSTSSKDGEWEPESLTQMYYLLQETEATPQDGAQELEAPAQVSQFPEGLVIEDLPAPSNDPAVPPPPSFNEGYDFDQSLENFLNNDPGFSFEYLQQDGELSGLLPGDLDALLQ